MLSLYFFEQYPRIIYLRWRMHRETGCLSEPERVWSEHTVVGWRWRATTCPSMQFVLCVEGEVTPHMPRLLSADWRPFVKLPKILPLKRLQQKETHWKTRNSKGALFWLDTNVMSLSPVSACFSRRPSPACARYAQKYSDLPGAINWKRQWVRALEDRQWKPVRLPA